MLHQVATRDLYHAIAEAMATLATPAAAITLPATKAHNQFGELIVEGCSTDEAYWRLVTDDIVDAVNACGSNSATVQAFLFSCSCE